ncbi:MAG: ABC transporter ATP-binding protein [Carbonactinosporaceae bacterium]
MILHVEDLTKHFVTGGAIERLFRRTSIVRAVDGVSFGLEKGKTLGIVGESGCGKTSLARTVARLYRPTGGRIVFDGRDITKLGEAEFRPMRRDIQMIFQDPLASLNPRRTIGDIVEKPLRVHRIDGNGRERVDEVLRAVGLDPRRHRDRYPYQLSGGQAQRVAIARALILDPALIIADEPVSSLDVSVQAQIINLLQRLQEQLGLSYLFISHDLSVVRHLTDHVMVMYLGKAVEFAPTERLFHEPLHPYTEALLKAVPRIHGRQEPIRLRGQPSSALHPPDGCAFHPRCQMKIGEICEAREPRLIEARSEHFVACHLHG